MSKAATLYQGTSDVVICEGFVGNVLLKAAEGMAEMMMKNHRPRGLHQSAGGKTPRGKSFGNLKKRYEYHEAGGAPLLGVDGICIICHGSSNSRSIYNALRVANTHYDRKLNQQIVDELEREEAPSA